MKPLADNRRALHNYEILEKVESGLMLQGWEVKSIRAGRAQIVDAHVVASRGELFLLNCHISPLSTASTHVDPDPTRRRKLLLHKKEISRLMGKSREKGFALFPLDLHLSKGKIKTTVALGRGKKLHDKRRAIEEKEWKRQQARILRKRF